MSLHGKVAVFSLGLCALLNIYSTQPLLPEIAREFHISTSQSAWTLSVTTLGIALMAPFEGAVSDRLGRKRVMLVAISAMFVTTLACSTAWNFTSLLVLRFAQGLLVPFVFAAAIAYVSEEYRASLADTANALFVSGTAFGGFLGRFISGSATVYLGWRYSFTALAIVLLVVLVAVATWLDRERHFRGAQSLVASMKGMCASIKNMQLVCTCFIGAAILFFQVGSFTYAALHLEAPPFGLNAFQVGAVFAVLLVAVVITPLTAVLVARIGRVNTFILANLLSLVGLGLTIIPTTTTVILGLAASSAGVFSGQACATRYIAESAETFRSGAIGLYLTSYYVGGSLGAIVPAPIYARGGWNPCAGVLAAVLVISSITALVAWPARPEPVN